MARYHRYRGRHGKRRGMVVFLVILLVLMILGGLTYFVLQNYLVYTEEGRVYLDIPWLSSNREEPPSPSPSVNIIIPSDDDLLPPPPPSESPTPPPAYALPIHALYVPLKDIENDTAWTALLRLIGDTQADALILEVKSDDGNLAFPASATVLEGTNLAPKTSKLAERVASLKDQGIYVGARLSCFQDLTLPQKRQTMGVKHNVGLNWLDHRRYRWIDPYKEEVRAYLQSVITDVAALGVDEIVLDALHFPVQGAIDNIDYGAAGETPRYETLEGFVDDVKAALALLPGGEEIVLSVVLLPETCLTGESAEGGQRLSALATRFDRFYAAVTPGPDFASDLTARRNGVTAVIGAANAEVRFVPVLDLPNAMTAEALGADLALMNSGSWVLKNAKLDYPLG